MKIAIGSDHGGFDFKQLIIDRLEKLGQDVVDVGCYSRESVDYPEFADAVCAKVRSGECERGILICGTGIGMSIAANRHRDIRAALCHESYTARMSREHNNANVLCLGGRVLGVEIALEIVTTWVQTEFAGGRHQRRLDMLS
ncbi:ribose 5-phosphate isomerase B [Desulfolithobacter dissulfuricans]|uniref:Ribose 5-phosphate isomerase B n=1 Tax=Desulfolithobacter dissulfuricans TaxID=2795293 RepID=A0A915U1B4_9BACT|nr:ribose 5-phosphate isomerase B [Desulfolithobacter dissulfuricans]BCO08657.1 ribose 5-phosphate isomerase B [Desulfolithobacter dissulfuricans]